MNGTLGNLGATMEKPLRRKEWAAIIWGSLKGSEAYTAVFGGLVGDCKPKRLIFRLLHQNGTQLQSILYGSILLDVVSNCNTS